MPDIDGAVSEALDAIRSALHTLAEKLEQDHFKYDMRGPMNSARDMLNDFEPVMRAKDAADERKATQASADERDLYANAPIVV